MAKEVSRWYYEQSDMHDDLLRLIAELRNAETCDEDGPESSNLTQALQAAEQWFSREEIVKADADIYAREQARINAERQRRSPTNPATGLMAIIADTKPIDLMDALRKGLEIRYGIRKDPDGEDSRS
jgi:hypothetical protein